MQVCTSTLQVLTLSRLRQGFEYDAFIVMTRDARLRAKTLRINGVSLFDGQRICTLVQGAKPAVQAWRQAALCDPPHELVSTLIEQPVDATDLNPSWRVGYCEVNDLDIFEAHGGLRADAALRAWHGVVACADLVG